MEKVKFLKIEEKKMIEEIQNHLKQVKIKEKRTDALIKIMKEKDK